MQEEVQEEPPTETQEEVVETINIPLMSYSNRKRLVLVSRL